MPRRSNWGDGSAVHAGTIATVRSGRFAVVGAHTYAASGTFRVHIRITDSGGAAASVTSTESVAPARIQSTLVYQFTLGPTFTRFTSLVVRRAPIGGQIQIRCNGIGCGRRALAIAAVAAKCKDTRCHSASARTVDLATRVQRVAARARCSADGRGLAARLGREVLLLPDPEGRPAGRLCDLHCAGRSQAWSRLLRQPSDIERACAHSSPAGPASSAAACSSSARAWPRGGRAGPRSGQATKLKQPGRISKARGPETLRWATVEAPSTAGDVDLGNAGAACSPRRASLALIAAGGVSERVHEDLEHRLTQGLGSLLGQGSRRCFSPDCQVIGHRPV